MYCGHLELEEGRRIGIVNGYEFLLGVIKIFWIREPSNLMNIVKIELYIKVILCIHYCLDSAYENHFSHLSRLAWIDTHTDVCNSWHSREGILENLNVLSQAPSSLPLDALALLNFNSPLCPLYLNACHTVVSHLLYSSLPLRKRWTSSPSAALGCPLYTIASFVNDLSLSGKRHSFLFERIHKSYFCSQEKR